MKIKSFVIITFGICLAYGIGNAEDGGFGAASYLFSGPDARAFAMGNAQAACAEGANALYWNPAAVVTTFKQDLVTSAAFPGFDRNFYYLAYLFPHKTEKPGRETSSGKRKKSRIKPFEKQMGAGLAIHHFTFSGLENRDEFGRLKSLGEDKETTVIFTFGSEVLRKGFSLGGNFKYHFQSLLGYTASGFGFDLGLFYIPPASRLKMAFVIQNIYDSLTWNFTNTDTNEISSIKENLTLLIKPGLCFALNDRIIIALDLDMFSTGKIKYHLGGEFHLSDSLDLRAGLNNNDPGGGFSFKYGIFRLDYALKYSLDGLGFENRLALGMSFGPDVRTRKRKIKKR